MRSIFFALSIALVGCNATQDAVSSSMQLSTPEEFATLIGKRLELNPSDYVVINADGTLAGEFGGVDTRGTWTIKEGYFCRELTSGPRGASPEDCQLFVKDGDTLNITRERGAGASFQYKIV
ncbi:MAG: hypothetical protein AAF754_20070 [Pseudomonadota bacterium]